MKLEAAALNTAEVLHPELSLFEKIYGLSDHLGHRRRRCCSTRVSVSLTHYTFFLSLGI